MHKFSFTAILVFVLTVFTTNQIFPQNTVSGLIIDSETGEPLMFGQAALMSPSDSTLITGSTSGLEGEYSFETSHTGPALLRISFMGYEETWMPVEIQSGTNKLGTIEMASAAQQLGEVQVTAAAMLFRSEADRRIFNVEEMTIAQGGTAIQLLETLPSVQVDEEGRISLRGTGNILIYINGRPTNLSGDDTESILEQYPANAIREVELITNPSARYEAEGVGGIINIILREERLRGMNGQVTLSSGTGNKYSGGFSLNFRQNDWNFFTSYSGQYREMWETTNSIRRNFVPGMTPILDQDYYTENWRQNHLFRLGTEYSFNNRSSARIYGQINAQSRDRERIYNIRSLNITNQNDSLYERLLTEDQSRMNYETGIDFLWGNNNGNRFRASATYAFNNQDRIEYFDQTQTYFGTAPIDILQINQFYERPESGNLFVVQADYEMNLLEQVKLETGVRGELRSEDPSQRFGQINQATGDTLSLWINGLPVTNDFTYNRDVFATYINFSDNRHRFTYMLGLRAEYSILENWQLFGLREGFLDADDFNPGEDMTHRQNHFGLFPSVFANWNIGQNQDIQASYSRRIARPWAGSMQPFLNAQDFFNLRLGNPYLQHQNTNNFELNYIRSWQNLMITSGVFHRYTTDAFTRLFVLFDKGSMVTWTNANTNSSTGVELINYFTLNNNYDATLTANFYHTEVSGRAEGREFSNQNYSWTLSLMSNLNFPGWFSTQISGNYWGPRVIPHGEIKPVFSMNLGLRRNVLNNRATVSLNISDVFNTRKFAMETQNADFYQQREFFRESRVLNLSFTYRFRDFRDRAGSDRNQNGIDGDIDGLY
jgi:iron complex outermembrane recepter protein